MCFREKGARVKERLLRRNFAFEFIDKGEAGMYIDELQERPLIDRG